MPAYVNSPFQAPQLVQKGVPAYLIGSFSQQIGNTRLALKSNAIASNVATVVGYYLGGPLPAVGSLISISGSANSSGAFNVSRVAVVSASLDASTNLLTVTFALTAANQASTADVGNAIVEPAETGETVSGTFTSQACCIQAPEGDSQFTVPVAVTGAAGITAMTATLQVAIRNIDSEYTNTTIVVTKTGASTYTAGPVVQATLQRGYFYRVAITSVTGSGAVIAKIGG